MTMLWIVIAFGAGLVIGMWAMWMDWRRDRRAYVDAVLRRSGVPL